MNINKQSFEEAIDILVNASPKNNTKGNAVKHWFSSNFKLEAGVSLTYDDKAIGNRVTEQFRHKFDVVIFVISTNVNIDTLKRYIKKNLYPELQVVLILTNTDPYTYNALLFNKESAFSSWAKETFRLDSEKFTFTKDKEAPSQEEKDFVKSNTNKFSSYYTAFRTKPFMLLAGISGTGKSRIVREFAFKSCPKELQDKDGTEPGNYCMIEVKPNWHDSTELLGYWSNLNKRYMFTKFAKFLVKAKMYPNVPFFVCLDEMNLAPVEQYFAEFLSVLETRKAIKDEEGNTIIKSGVLIDKEYFRSIGKVGKDEKEQGFATCKNDRDIYMKLFNIVDEEKMNAIPENKETSLLDTGLTLPENVLVIGTVNMDDTTHQFSRKVIDRAMTIEMNGGALTDIFSDKDDLAYRENPLSMDDLRAKYVSAKEVIKNCTAITKNEDILKYIKGETENGLPQRLEEINKALYGTPFMVSYRVMNELTIYLAVLLDKAEKDGQEISLEVCKQLANTAIDKILLMKILPRVEGDDEMFRISEKERTANGFSDQADDGHEFTKLDWLRQIAPQHTEDNKDSYMAVDKLSEMIERLNRQSFTRFWP
ncbi:hypothetical protein DXA63_08965 [Segatella copri]|uniref:Restriction endonuclease n=1 Tax=Segatella copri TaxID=165179 RepID=A0AA92ULA8_9BACT|nr:hypothetical protein DXA63_08965 [Segatella copri]